MRFYMGTIFIRQRADLTRVYVMIFRRLRGLGADWVYHFRSCSWRSSEGCSCHDKQPTRYSVSEAAVRELKHQKKRAEMACFRADIAEMNGRARQEAVDRPPPATVRAYREVYGCDPRGWPLPKNCRLERHSYRVNRPARARGGSLRRSMASATLVACTPQPWSTARSFGSSSLRRWRARTVKTVARR